MLNIRVIPTLLLRNNGLYKGEAFKNHKYVGDPINAVKIFNEKEVDEILVLDISASIERRQPNFELLEDIASQAFMPFGYGGGVKDLKTIEKIFKLGVEKVVINSAAIENINLIKEASSEFGAQSIIVSIDYKSNLFGKKKVYSMSGTHKTNYTPFELALKAEDYGAGEVILCDIDREGSGKGYPLDLVTEVSENLSIPLVVSGGAHSRQCFVEAVKAGASAVAAGSMFVFHGKHKAVLITYPEYKELESLFGGTDVK